jgi:hypothetical protein
MNTMIWEGYLCEVLSFVGDGTVNVYIPELDMYNTIDAGV